MIFESTTADDACVGLKNCRGHRQEEIGIRVIPACRYTSLWTTCRCRVPHTRRTHREFQIECRDVADGAHSIQTWLMPVPITLALVPLASVVKSGEEWSWTVVWA